MQTSQRHPITGTPWEVPEPRIVSFIGTKIRFAFKNGKPRIKNSDLSSRRGSLREFRREDQPLHTCRSEFAEDTVVRASAGGGAGPCGAEMSQGIGIPVSPVVLLSVLSVSSRPAEDAFRAAETRCSPPHQTAADCRSSINGMNNLRCVERTTDSAVLYTRSGRSRRCRHCFRYFRSAIPQAGGLLNEKRRIQIGINQRCAKRTTVSALRKSGKKNGRRMRRRKRGRELVRVAF